MNSTLQIAACPIMVGINVDVDVLDAENAGKAGLFGRYSYGRYGVREGVWRLLDALGENGVVGTFFVIPDDIARHAHALQAILDSGHEIAVRGQVCAKVGAHQQLDRLALDREALERLIGYAPNGWRALNGIVTQDTLPALAKAGYLYDSSAQDDDVPYVMRGDSADVGLVELPVFDYLTDAVFYTHRHTDARVLKAWREEADAQHCAGGYINLTLHSRGDVGSGRPPRARAVSDFLRELGKRPGVGFYSGEALARAWRETHAAVELFPTMRQPQI